MDAWNLHARQIQAAGVVILCDFCDLTVGDQNEYDDMRDYSIWVSERADGLTLTQ